MNVTPTSVLAAAALAVFCRSALAQWPQSHQAYSVQRLGMFGPMHTRSDGWQSSTFNQIPLAQSLAVGFSERYAGASFNGRDAWIWNGTATVQVGLTGPGYARSGGYQFSSPGVFNDHGQAAGSSARFTTGNASNGESGWVWTGTATVQIGLTGPEYTGSGGWQGCEPRLMNNSGRVTGISERYTGVNTRNGQDAWFWDGTNTIQVGWNGPGNGGTGYRATEPHLLNEAGQVAGYAYRYVGLVSNGRDAWVWDGTTTSQAGLTGPEYTGSAGYQVTTLRFLSDSGRVAGRTIRVIGLNSGRGEDAWVWNGTTNVQVGFTGPGYTGSAGHQFSEPLLMNGTGQVAGWSTRITGLNTSNGQDAWAWSGTTTVQIGLTGPGYAGSTGYQFSEPRLQNDAGQIAGYSHRVSGVDTRMGQDAWVWNGTTHVQVGLTGPSYTGSTGYQFSEPRLQNAGGQLAGYSYRVTGIDTLIGQDTWVWNGATTVQVGLAGPGYTGSGGRQFGEHVHQGDSGQVTGYSHRYTGVDTYLGRDAWVWNGTTTVQVGLTGPGYTGSAGYQYSELHHRNDAGQVTGRSFRYSGVNTPIGESAWYFDPATNTTYDMTAGVPDSVRSSDGFAYSAGSTLTADGYVLGVYATFAGGVGPEVRRSFAFRPDLGFTDLGALVAGGLTAAGWSVLSETSNIARLPSVTHVMGYGRVLGQTAGQSAFVMSVPASGAAANVTYGTGCGGLTLTVAPNPVLGQILHYTTSNIPAAAPLSLQLVSLLDLDPGTSLASYGAPGCELLVDLNFTSTIALFGGPTANYLLALPSSAAMVGVSLHGQSATLDTTANALGMVFSNGVRSTVMWY